MDGYMRDGIRRSYKSQIRSRLRSTLTTQLVEWWKDEVPLHKGISFKVPKAEFHRFNPSSFSFYCEFAGTDCLLATNAVFDGAGWILYASGNQIKGGPVVKNSSKVSYHAPILENRALISFDGKILLLNGHNFALLPEEIEQIVTSSPGIYLSGLGSSCGRPTKKGTLRNAAYWTKAITKMPTEYPRGIRLS